MSGPQFVDCNCNVSDKCPQGKAGQRNRCLIPVEKASIGNDAVATIVARSSMQIYPL